MNRIQSKYHKLRNYEIKKIYLSAGMIKYATKSIDVMK